HAEVDQDLRTVTVAARHRRIDHAIAGVPDRVRAQLVPVTHGLGTAQVQDDTAPLSRHPTHCPAQLGAALATRRAEHVAGQALGVDPYDHVAPVGQVAVDQRHVVGVVEPGTVSDRLEHAEVGGKACLGDPFNLNLGTSPVGEQLGYRDQREVVLCGEPFQVSPAHDGAVVVYQLAEHPGRMQLGESGQVDCGLGGASPLQHAALTRPERHDVP